MGRSRMQSPQSEFVREVEFHGFGPIECLERDYSRHSVHYRLTKLPLAQPATLLHPLFDH